MKLKGYLITATVALASALLLGLWMTGYWDHRPPLKPIVLPPLSPPQEPAPAPLVSSPTSVEDAPSQPPPEPVANNVPPPEPAPAVEPVPTAEDSSTGESSAVQQQIKQAVNNLRQLASAAQQYMLDKGVTEATYPDVVGTNTDSYIRSITPAADENYQDIVIGQTTTQISINSQSFGSVIYNL